MKRRRITLFPPRSLSARSDASNLADLTAKTGSQTIVASLCGLALGVAASNACGADPSNVWPAWAALSAFHLAATYASLRYVATTTLDDARLASLVDAFRARGTCPTPQAVAETESLLVADARGAARWLRFGARVSDCAASPDAFRALLADHPPGATALVCPGEDLVRVLLYDDAAPDDVLRAAYRAADARDGETSTADDAAAARFAAAVADAGWRVDQLPVAFDKGRLLRAPPAPKADSST